MRSCQPVDEMCVSGRARFRRALMSRLRLACLGLQDAGLAGQQGYFNGQHRQLLDDSRYRYFLILYAS